MRFLPYGLMMCLLALAGCDRETVDPTQPSIEHFLADHWPRVLPAQGEPPAHFTPQEASLAPLACGECHVAQFEQWQTSLHSHTMGPGIQWQLQLMSQEQGNKCLRCHAPLAEQKALVALQRQWPNAPVSAAPAWVPANLAEAGLACAACHVRRHQRFGPPARQALPEDLPHAGFTASPVFQDSRFCAACHQHRDEDRPPRINGKLHVDTWSQWQQSPQAQQGMHCQTCHMPDRQHLWRGIHDADMTRQALDVRLQVKRSGENRVLVEARLHNQGAGHHFPTYMVPRIDLVFSLHDRNSGERRRLYHHVIGWQVNVELTKERFDTRIPAGDTHVLRLPELVLPATEGAWDIELVMDVAPRDHYERTFRSSLKQADKLPATTLNTLREALREAEATRYRLLELRQPVPAWPIAN